MEVYLAASGASAKEGKVQTVIILNCAGPQVLKVYDKSVWENLVLFKLVILIMLMQNICDAYNVNTRTKRANVLRLTCQNSVRNRQWIIFRIVQFL